MIIYMCHAYVSVQFSSVPSLSHVKLFVTPWTAARQASLSISNSRSFLTLMSTESLLPSNHLIYICIYIYAIGGFPGTFSGSEPTCQCRRHKRHRFNPRVRKIP